METGERSWEPGQNGDSGGLVTTHQRLHCRHWAQSASQIPVSRRDREKPRYSVLNLELLERTVQPQRQRKDGATASRGLGSQSFVGSLWSACRRRCSTQTPCPPHLNSGCFDFGSAKITTRKIWKSEIRFKWHQQAWFVCEDSVSPSNSKWPLPLTADATLCTVLLRAFQHRLLRFNRIATLPNQQ